MKTRLITVAALLASTVSAGAVGLDRSGQRVGVLFETGNHAEVTLSFTNPTLEGSVSNPFFAGLPDSGNVADTFRSLSGAIKYDINDKWSVALIGDEPFGADIFYENGPAASALGGTGATVDSYAITALARYKFTDRWSVHGGLRYQEVSANVSLGGVAFQGLSGFNAAFASDGDVGYVIGGAFEIPEIALRVALTYNSSTTHDLETTETINGVGTSTLTGGLLGDTSRTSVDTPESINLAFQTGVATNTLVFGSIRYARYSGTIVEPAFFTGIASPGNALTDLEDGFDVELGVGRRFNEKWSGSVAVGFSTVGDDNLVSPLTPTNGSRYISVGAKYDANEKFAISGGVRYTSLGSAFSSPGGTPIAFFDGNDAVTLGVKLAFKF
ncbi:MAG: outer membrane protein transport protein [Tateyamaria sp.]|uniref:outer membrane protein transport protein n=1 Tax=Tateyamaria sp. TaxID=1929288 RepID=UPI00329FDBFC